MTKNEEVSERAKILLQRAAVRRWYRMRYSEDSDRPNSDDEKELRRIFPLPPGRIVNIVKDAGGNYEYRLNPNTDTLEYRRVDCTDSWHLHSGTAAVREVLAHPFIEQPDPEDLDA